MSALTDGMLTFETLRRQVRIGGRLTTTTAFRIGTGRDTEAHTPDLPIIRDSLGRPFIPGSSLKGAMRSAVEAVARVLGQASVKEAACLCTDGDNQWCVSRAKRKELAGEATSDAELAASIWSGTCRVCRVFGSPWFAGKLHVSDCGLRPECEARRTSETRNGVAIDRDTGTAADGRLFQYEVAPAGLEFDFHVSIDNPNRDELGMALIAVKLMERGDVRIGGATSRGLGGCVLNVTSVTEFIPDGVASLVEYLTGGEIPQIGPDAQKACIKHCLEQLAALGSSAPKEGGTDDAQDAPEPSDY